LGGLNASSASTTLPNNMKANYTTWSIFELFVLFLIACLILFSAISVIFELLREMEVFKSDTMESHLQVGHAGVGFGG
jgi:hypothetical protein